MTTCTYCHGARLVGWSGAGPILCPECSRGQDAFAVITQAWREQRIKAQALAERLAIMERERDEALSEAHAAAKENEAMLTAIEKLSAELAKPEGVRLREAVDAMGDRCPQFFSLAGRIDRLLDDVDEWIARAGSAERTVEEQGRLLASTQNIVREIQSASKGDAYVDGLHSRIDALVAIAEAAEDLCRAVGEREEIAPHVFRQWAAVKAALHLAEIGAERS